MKRLLCSAFAVTTVICASSALAGEVQLNGSETSELVFDGEIVDGDAVKFRDALAKNKIKLVFLNSIGGLIAEAYDMAEMLRIKGISTYVDVGDECLSACVLMFAAGKEPGYETGALIGVHQASAAQQLAREDAEEVGSKYSIATAEAYKAYGVSDSAIGKMTNTPSTSMTYLTDEDLVGWARKHR